MAEVIWPFLSGAILQRKLNEVLVNSREFGAPGGCECQFLGCRVCCKWCAWGTESRGARRRRSCKSSSMRLFITPKKHVKIKRLRRGGGTTQEKLERLRQELEKSWRNFRNCLDQRSCNTEFTPLKFLNMKPDNQPLEINSPFGNHHFQTPCQFFGGVGWKKLWSAHQNGSPQGRFFEPQNGIWLSWAPSNKIPIQQRIW